MHRGRWLWGILLGIVLVVEVVTLFWDAVPPLSVVVIDMTAKHPETFGAAVLLLLAWLIYHWFIAPLWRRWRSGGE